MKKKTLSMAILSMILISSLFTLAKTLIKESLASPDIPLPALDFCLYSYSWDEHSVPGHLRIVPHDGRILPSWDAGSGNNNVEDEYVENVGPIPEGKWFVGQETNFTTKEGITVYGYLLTPYPDTDTGDRPGKFYIHAYVHNQYRSAGCIVLNNGTGANTYDEFNQTIRKYPEAQQRINNGTFTLVVRYPPPPSGNATVVGGIVIPIDKFGLLAPYIGLASTVVVATVATAVYVKRVKHRKEKQ